MKTKNKNASLKKCIENVRGIIFPNLLTINASIVKSLKDLKKHKEFEQATFFDDLKKDHFIFSFPFTPLTSKVVYPDGVSFSFPDMLELFKDKVDVCVDD